MSSYEDLLNIAIFIIKFSYDFSLTCVHNWDLFKFVTTKVIRSVLCTQKMGAKMVGKMEIISLDEREFPRAKRVSVFKRKTAGKVYEGVRIVLSSRYKDFVGKKYRVFVGRARWSVGSDIMQEGDVIILFFPDSWNKPSQLS